MNDTQVPIATNSEYKEIMMNMMLDIMAKQNIILAHLTDMNGLDPDMIDEQIVEEKKAIIDQMTAID